MELSVCLDVRIIPQWQRHARIFAAFDALLSAQTLIITSDHEPRPLRAQFDERYQKRFTWDQRRIGDGGWEVRIAKHGDTSAEYSPLALLQRNAILGKAGEAELTALLGRSRRVSIKRHHSIVGEGVRWPYAGIVEHGIVQAVLVGPSGREQALFDVLPDEFFGEVAVLDSGAMPLRHIALTAHADVLLIPSDAVTALLQRRPDILASIGSLAAQRFRTVLACFASHLGTPAVSRVAQVLLPFAQPAQGMCDALPPLPSMTQGELATSAGTVKEVVSRALSDLESAGAIARLRGHIVQLDRKKLTEVAAGRVEGT